VSPIEVREIKAEETYSLRHAILRPQDPIENCFFIGDEASTNFHLGAFSEGKVVSVASFFLESNKFFSDHLQYRLRGMATDPRFRLQGVGARLIKNGEEILKKKKSCTLLWFNARQVAFGFYERLGYQFKGEAFELPGIGPHKVMFKSL
jgi:GNAT superfamily N-acetyltransferase